MALTCVKATSALVLVLHRDLPVLGRPALGPGERLRLPAPARVPATHPLQMQLAKLAQSLLALLRHQLLGRRGPVFCDIRGHLQSQPASGSASPRPQPGPDTPASPVLSPGFVSCPARRHPDRALREAGGTSTSVAAAITAFSLLPATTTSTSVGLQPGTLGPAPSVWRQVLRRLSRPF